MVGICVEYKAVNLNVGSEINPSVLVMQLQNNVPGIHEPKYLRSDGIVCLFQAWKECNDTID